MRGGFPDADTLRALIVRELGHRQERVFSVMCEGRKVWVKRPVPHKRRVWHRCQRVAAAIVRVPMLAVTADTEGSRALTRECRIIGALRAKGVSVPEILAEEADWVALGDLGRSLADQVRAAPTPDAARRLVEAGAHALARLHALGAWHGNPLLRNIAGAPERLGFLDFEEDPARRMSPLECQTRDVLFYLFSVGAFSGEALTLQQAALAAYLEQAAPEVRRRLRRVAWGAAPLALLLSPLRRRAGRDVRQGLDAWRVLFAMRDHDQPRGRSKTRGVTVT